MTTCPLCGATIGDAYAPSYMTGSTVRMKCQACVRGADEVQREMRTIEDLALEFKAPYHGMQDSRKTASSPHG